jgi:predicted ATPase
MAAHLATGNTAFFQARFDLARAHMERGLTFHDAEFGPSQVLAYGQDLQSAALGYLSSTYGITGSLDQAVVCADRGLAVARQCEHPFTLAFALMLCGHVHQLRREPAMIRRRGDELAVLAREQGFAWFTAVAEGLIGSAESAENPTGPGVDRMREATRSFLTFHRIGLAHRTHLAEALVSAGLVDEALDLVENTLAQANETGDHTHLAELRRIRGEAFVRLARPTEARSAFVLAFEVASRQGARVFALRAATALVALAVETAGRAAAASDLERLATTYAGFTEGLDLEDLAVARRLLSHP